MTQSNWTIPTLYVEGNTKIPTTSHNENQKVQVIEKDLPELALHLLVSFTDGKQDWGT